MVVRGTGREEENCEEQLFDFLEENIDVHGLSSAPLLLKTCEASLAKVEEKLSPDGEIGSALGQALRDIAQSEDELRALDAKRVALLKKIADFNGHDKGTVGELEALRGRIIELQRTEWYMNQSKRVMELRGIGDSLDRLKQLAEIREELPECCEDLCREVSKQIEELVDSYKGQVMDNLEAALTAASWPQPMPASDLELKERGRAGAICKEAASLANLQLLALPSRHDAEVRLWVMDMLLAPLNKRFMYHFRSARPTNRRDKPEWFLTHQLARIRDHWKFVTDRITPAVIQANTRGFNIVPPIVHFCEELVSACKDKILSDYKDLIDGEGAGGRDVGPQEEKLLLKVLDEAIAFDQALFDEVPLLVWLPGRQSSLRSEVSCVSMLCKHRPLVARWCALEVSQAQQSFQKTVDAEDAFQIRRKAKTLLDGEGMDEEEGEQEGEGTYGAEGVMYLVERAGERFKCLPMLADRLLFFKLVQEEAIIQPFIAVLRSKIREWMQRWERWCVARRQLAINQKHRSARIATKVVDAAAYLASSEKVEEQDASEPPLIDLVAFADAAVYSYRALLDIGDSDAYLDLQLGGSGDDGASVLGEACQDLKRIVSDVGGVIVSAICGDFKDLSAEYQMEGRLWSPQVRWSQRAGFELSEDLCQPLATLRNSLRLIKSDLHPYLTTSVWREIAEQVDQHLLNAVIGKGLLSLSGAKQWRFDVEAVSGVFSLFTAKPLNILRRLNQASALLTLPIQELKDVAEAVGGLGGREAEHVLEKYPLSRLSREQIKTLCKQRIEGQDRDDAAE